jgi:hypothetical protein
MKAYNGVSVPRFDGSAKFYQKGQFRPENFYPGEEDASRPWVRGRANCGE